MRVIGEGYERAIEHISNSIRFKRAIHTFMQAALQCSNPNNFIITWNENIARLVNRRLLEAQEQMRKKEKRERYFDRRQRAS